MSKNALRYKVDLNFDFWEFPILPKPKKKKKEKPMLTEPQKKKYRPR
jgi:hypothetical protein